MAEPKEKKNEGGRPPLFDDPEKLQIKIDEYFQQDGKKTISGLAYYLGFEDRQSFYDYGKRDGFSYIIKRARLWMESYYEELTQGNNVAGPIFVLKNMGWRDAHDLTSDGKQIIPVIRFTDDSD